jgi:hypothetical protein
VAYQFLIELPVRREWSNADLVRRSVQSCLVTAFEDASGRGSVAMVAGELLENAIKYGDWTDLEACCRVHVRGDAKGAEVWVENPVDTKGAPELLSTLQWMSTFPSAEEAYRTRLLQIATEADGASKLGLLRIANEGKCKLRAAILGNTLRVMAHIAFSPPANAS